MSRDDRLTPAGLGRVCIVSSEFLGITKNGGIGTAHSLLADLLIAHGCEVTLLYSALTSEPGTAASIDATAACWAERGVALHHLDASVIERHDAPHFAARSIAVFEWLEERDGQFDVVHFAEWQGDGYYSLLARHQGVAFRNTVMLVNTHSPKAWAAEANQEIPCDPRDLELDFMERRSVELADQVVSPSAFLLEWMGARGWAPPRRATVIQNVVEPALRVERPPARPQRVTEIVYFGRLEFRKGLDIFCDAIDRLDPDRLAPLTISFLGRSVGLGPGTGLGYAQNRASGWQCRNVQILDDFDRDQALTYLRQPGRLAIIPSRTENSPYTVLECVVSGIPVLAAATGGIPELVDPSVRDRVLFAPHGAALAAAIGGAIAHGATPARPSTEPLVTAQRWVELYRNLVADSRDNAASRPGHAASVPRVRVCITHHERPEWLRAALASFAAQDYPNFELIVVDDGSRSDETVAALQEIETYLDDRGWRLIRSENRYLGAARNLAAESAESEYLLFFDDDNVAKPQYLSTLVAVAERTAADIVTCRSKYFTERVPTDANERSCRGYVPLGPALVPGLFRNCFGDAAALVRTSAFVALGGFTTEREAACQDWEMFSRATLAGMKLEVVPKVLYYYRVTPNSMYRTVPDGPSQLLRLRPYFDRLPPDLHALARVAYGMWRKAHAPAPGQHADAEWALLRSLVRRAREVGCSHAYIYGASTSGRQLAAVSKSEGLHVEAFVDRDASLVGTHIDGLEVRALSAAVHAGADAFLVGSFARGDEIAAVIEAAYACCDREATVIHLSRGAVISVRGGRALSPNADSIVGVPQPTTKPRHAWARSANPLPRMSPNAVTSSGHPVNQVRAGAPGNWQSG